MSRSVVGLPGWLVEVSVGEVSRNDSLGWFDDTSPVSSMTREGRRLSGVVGSFRSLRRTDCGVGEGLSFDQAVWVVANVISERGWFDGDKPEEYLIPGNNLGGWKINEGHVREWRNKGRKPEDIPRWFRDVGHVGSGDQPVVYYRVFSSVEKFFEEWLRRFVPRPGSVGGDHRYYKTGIEFWNGKIGWFRELCLAGYKGPVTQGNPERSVRAFSEIAKRVAAMIVQDMLNKQTVVPGLRKLEADGVWGEKSVEVAAKYLRGIGGGKQYSTESLLRDSLRQNPTKELVESLMKHQTAE
jgi:hypothetical protein